MKKRPRYFSEVPWAAFSALIPSRDPEVLDDRHSSIHIGQTSSPLTKTSGLGGTRLSSSPRISHHSEPSATQVRHVTVASALLHTVSPSLGSSFSEGTGTCPAAHCRTLGALLPLHDAWPRDLRMYCCVQEQGLVDHPAR